EGREPVEEFFKIDQKTTMMVHKMDASGRIFDQVINLRGEVLYEFMPTLRAAQPYFKERYDGDTDYKFLWFEIVDAKNGFILPVEWNGTNYRKKEDLKNRLANFVGVKFLVSPKQLVPGKPKIGGRANEKILEAYGNTS